MIQMLECLQLSQRFLSLSSFFKILVSLFCSRWMFISPFCSKLLIWVLVSLPSLLVPCIFFLYFTLYSHRFFLYFKATLNHFFEHPDHQCLNSASDRLVISIHLVLFLGFCSVVTWAIFLFSSVWQPPCVCFCVLGWAAWTSVTGTCKECGAEP